MITNRMQKALVPYGARRPPERGCRRLCRGKNVAANRTRKPWQSPSDDCGQYGISHQHPLTSDATLACQAHRLPAGAPADVGTGKLITIEWGGGCRSEHHDRRP